MPAYLDTGLNLVDVRDVAVGHLLACNRGRPGERYILGRRNMTLEQIYAALEAISGVAAPRWRIPYAVALAAGMVSTALASVAGGEPRAPLDGVRMARKKMFVKHDKAAAGLGFAPGPAVKGARRAPSRGFAPTDIAKMQTILMVAADRCEFAGIPRSSARAGSITMAC